MVYPRNGYDGAEACRQYTGSTEIKGVRYLDGAPLLNISSTEIRNRTK